MRDINLTELGFINLLILVTCVIAVIAAIAAFVWLIINWRQYRKDVKDAVLREEQGLFDISKYADKTISACVSPRQENNGPEPETFDRDIPCINHFEVLDFDRLEPKSDTEKKRGVI